MSVKNKKNEYNHKKKLIDTMIESICECVNLKDDDVNI